MSQDLGYFDPSSQARALAGKQPRRPPDEVLGGENAPMRETWNLGRAVSHLLTGGRCPFKNFSQGCMFYKYVFPLVVLSCFLKAQLRQEVVLVMIISVVMKWLVFKGKTKAHLDSVKLIMSKELIRTW